MAMNKNIDDICEMARRLSNFIGEAQTTGIDFKKEDLDITIYANKEELQSIDKALYEMTNKNGNRTYNAADKIEATILGIKFTVVEREKTMTPS